MRKWRIFQVFGSLMIITSLVMFKLASEIAFLLYFLIAFTVVIVLGFFLFGKPPWEPGAKIANKRAELEAKIVSDLISKNKKQIATVSLIIILLVVMYVLAISYGVVD